MIKEEKVLTRELVENLGLYKVAVITADMLDGYTSIDDWAFRSCIGLTSIKIPNSVTSIGYSAFEYCCSLTSVTIPNSVTSIGHNAFRSCIGLTSIKIPDSVTSIGYSAFEYCCSLTSVTIPNSVTSIGNGVFSGCISLTSVAIPNSVTSIGSYAFNNCKSLTSVTIGNSVTSIGYAAFDGCNFIQEKKIDKLGRIVAYKGFKVDMTCRNFQYKEGESYKIDGDPIICEHGFHACLNPLDCLYYYWGKIGKDIVFHEVYLEGVSKKRGGDSKVVARKITIGRELTLLEMADIASGRK